MASPWSLERELCGLARVRSAGKALWRFGVIADPAIPVVLKEVQKWTRAGAETFVYRFHAVTPDATHDLLLKAVVGFSTAHSLVEITEEWVARRRLIAGEGISTPRLYCASGAVLLETYIPHKLADFLSQTSGPTDHLLSQVIRLAATLDKHGFNPLSPFHSLRTDGADVFAVDFGQDLGPAAAAPRCDGKLLRQALSWIERSCKKRRQLDASRARAIYSYYAADKKGEATLWT
jgi:hypothetical protein